METIDRRLADLAGTRHGLVTLSEALATGLSRSQVKYRVTSGRWDRVGYGVYRLSGVPETWQQRALVVCLAAPDGATASHLTGAALAGIEDAPPHLPNVTVGLHRSTRLPGAVVHRARLGPVDYTTFQGVPTTTVARTLVDCAAVVGPRHLQRLVDTALHRHLVTPAQVAHAWDQARLRPGRAGEVRLRAALEGWDGPIRPGSPAEVRLERQVVQWGYPAPDRQVVVRNEAGIVIARLDLGWPARRIGLEYDGLVAHGPSRWGPDEARHRTITDLGWTVLHADKTDLLPGSRRLHDALDRAWSSSAAA